MFTRIVVGIDGSRPAEAAAQTALELAARQQAHLYMVSVIEELPHYVSTHEEIMREESEAEHYFQHIHRRLEEQGQRRGVATTSTVLTGHEVQQLLQYVMEVRADLLIIGYAGHSAVWDSALGSTAHQLLRRTPCSMLVVRSAVSAAEAAIHLSRIAIALDGSPLGWEAFAEALTLGNDTHYPLHVLSVVDSVPIGAETIAAGAAGGSNAGMADVGGDAWHTFLLHAQARAAAQAATLNIPIEVHMRPGPVSDTLVAGVRELGVDVLILGATGHERPWARVTGATAIKVAEEAPCAVLVVRPPTAGATVADAMLTAPTPISPDTPATAAFTMFLNEATRLLPVLDADRKVVGVVTLGMVLRRVNPGLIAPRNRPGSVATELNEQIQHTFVGQTARDIMNPRPYMVRLDTPLEVAARYLTAHHITRAPVVDDELHLVGVVGEREVILRLLGLVGHTLRAAPETPAEKSVANIQGEVLPTATSATVSGLPTVGELVDRRVPMLAESAPVDEVLAAVDATPAGLVIVLSADHQLRGVIEAQSLLQQVAQEEESPAGTRVWQALVRSPSQVLRALRGVSPVTPLTAARLARPARCILRTDMPVGEALARLISTDVAASGHAGVVLAHDGRPEGVLWRSHALRALVRG